MVDFPPFAPAPETAPMSARPDEREANERARVGLVAVPMGPTGAAGKGFGMTTAEAIERMRALAGPRPLSRRLADSGAPLAEVCDQLLAEGYKVENILDTTRRAVARVTASTDVDVETYLAAVERAQEQLASAEAWAERRAHERRLASFDASMPAGVDVVVGPCRVERDPDDAEIVLSKPRDLPSPGTGKASRR